MFSVLKKKGETEKKKRKEKQKSELGLKGFNYGFKTKQLAN